jgi:nitronate monooxygenase
MGIAVSGWKLANAVGQAGQMGVVSGTAIDLVHARQLADGDEGGHLRRAYSHFPIPEMAQRVLDRYFIEGGRDKQSTYKNVPNWEVEPPLPLIELAIVSNFAEVFLAKENNTNPVGVNYLEKIQLPVVASTIGAMLAGVDAVIMGAGIPKQMPKLIRDLSQGKIGEYKINVDGALSGEEFFIRLDPKEILGQDIKLHAPAFLAIISSNTLASFLLKDPEARPDGFVVELPSAGGHNSPPRGTPKRDESGQPIYADRDFPDFEKMTSAGLPYWIAGGFGKPDMLKNALELGARGVQVGTAFAFSDESGFAKEVKEQVFEEVAEGRAQVFTDPVASPSGFPFKVVQLPGTSSVKEVHEARVRNCDLGYLRSSFRKDDGTVGYRCASEPVKAYLRKGGKVEETEGRKCLCNALMANIGLGQLRKGEPESTLVTSGDNLSEVIMTLGKGRGHYSAADVLAYIETGCF